ncbi:MAG: hypothetical protein PVS3B3_13440 [Ktedonobacteraceae bacterium]
MATQASIVASVFEQEALARRALTALKQAGFDYDQVGVVTPGQKGVNLKNDLIGLAMPREQANYYAQEFKAGRTVVSVRPDGREQEAHDILHQYSGYDYEHQTMETQTAAGYTRNATALSAQTTAEDAHDDFHQPRSLKLREERVNVSKERVQAGEVDLHKEVIMEQKTINVPVMHEEAFIERRAVTGAAASDTTPIGEGESIRVPLSEERVSVRKETIVTGEVSVGKRAVEETQHVAETARREEVRVEQQGDAPIHGTKSDRFHPNSVNEDPLV